MLGTLASMHAFEGRDTVGTLQSSGSCARIRLQGSAGHPLGAGIEKLPRQKYSFFHQNAFRILKKDRAGGPPTLMRSRDAAEIHHESKGSN
jgi:hypothetical protein